MGTMHSQEKPLYLPGGWLRYPPVGKAIVEGNASAVVLEPHEALSINRLGIALDIPKIVEFRFKSQGSFL